MANAATATYPGRTILWQRMRGAGTEPKNLKWGGGGANGTTASANSNVALFGPFTELGVAGVSNILQSANGFLGDTYYCSGTITCLVGGKTITEMVLSDTITLSGTTSISLLSQAAASSSISLATGASLPASGNFYIQVENETELVIFGQGTASLSVVRAQLGSTSAAHGIGAIVTLGGDGGASGVALGSQTAAVTATLGGSNFMHADFSGIALNVNDSILFSVFDTLS